MSEAVPNHVAIGDAVIFNKLHDQQKLQDQIVLLNMSTQQYFGLDDVGTVMWNFLIELGDVDAVTDRLLATYDAGRETVAADLQRLVNDLMEKGLLKNAAADSNNGTSN